jgi:hypothetical protein
MEIYGGDILTDQFLLDREQIKAMEGSKSFGVE